MRGLARAVAVGGMAALVMARPGVASADGLPAALTAQPLPMAIRDGRMAEVAVHAVPFAIGSQDLAAATESALDRIAAAAATDCFVTAQTVGHVQPGTPGDGGTLAAHRLARARAEAVKAALVRAGLPEGAVASVWDYQFSLREPRVTLWIFELPKGEACAGAPLPGVAARMALAKAEPPAIEPVAVVATTAVAGPRDGQRSFEPAPGIHIPDPAAHGAAKAADPPMLADASGASWPVAPFERLPLQTGFVPSVAPPAAEIAEQALPTMTAVAAAPQAGPSPAPAAVASAEIVFAENSSYFPPGAQGELQRLAAVLGQGRHWEIELQATVDDKAGRRDSPATARAYNAWLAERRQGRVADWLAQQPELQAIPITRATIEHDPSRRVLIIARPLP